MLRKLEPLRKSPLKLKLPRERCNSLALPPLPPC